MFVTPVPYQTVQQQLRERFHPIPELDNRIVELLLQIQREHGQSDILLVDLAAEYVNEYGVKLNQEMKNRFSLDCVCPGLIKIYFSLHPNFNCDGEGAKVTIRHTPSKKTLEKTCAYERPLDLKLSPIQDVDVRIEEAIRNAVTFGNGNDVTFVVLGSTYKQIFGKSLKEELSERFHLPLPANGIIKAYFAKHPNFSILERDGALRVRCIKRTPSIIPQKSYTSFSGKGEQPEFRPIIRMDEDDLLKFAFIPNERLDELIALALEENWTISNRFPNGVLRNYLKYTFQRAVRCKKLKMGKSKYAIFNTGLVNRNYDWIYAYFEPNGIKGKQPWFLKGFCIPGEGPLGKTVVSNVGAMPEQIEWFTEHEERFFNPKWEVLPDWRHIIVDNLERFPLVFLKRFASTSDSELYKTYEEIEQAQEAFTATFDELRNIVTGLASSHPDLECYKGHAISEFDLESIKKKITLPHFKTLDDSRTKIRNAYVKAKELLRSDAYANERNEIERRLKNEKELACKKAERDYTIAIPTFFPTKETYSFLLPLCLVDPKRVDLALVVSKGGEGAYQGQTVLTLDMAYTNARLLRRLDAPWIRP